MKLKENTLTVYNFITEHHRQHGYYPTQREIADGCYMARSTVFYHLEKLRQADLIDTSNKHRHLKPTAHYTDVSQLAQWRKENS